ncbi:MAG: hypothetical protein QF893_15935 [Alphaproteobacteria bacterium]|jgi:hypothetical protein|nr:hypothetical protein [Alphaproteobacteria bacterium]
MRLVRGLFALLLAAQLWACDDSGDDQPYVEIVGGGFIFNYRLAEAYYGFVARVVRQPPDGAILEATFENPSRAAPIVQRQVYDGRRTGYKFETPPLRGIEAERDYRVELRLLTPDGGTVIASYATSFRTYTGQEVLPKRPLTVGPGY